VIAAEIIDSKRMINPTLNSCKSIFGIGKNNLYVQTRTATSEELKFAEEKFMTWITGNESPAYLKDLDPKDFHFQFLPFTAKGVYKMGIVVIIPEEKIDSSFYSDLACGLEIPGDRCLQTFTPWYNNGDILSTVVTMHDGKMDQFKNWRLEQEGSEEEAIDSYYSELFIAYKTAPEKVNLRILHYVDGNFKEEIAQQNLNHVLLPKGRISSLVFLVNGHIKGILCYDLNEIRGLCPMTFATEVYLKDRLGYGRILYTKPLCETLYTWAILDQKEFEDITNLKTDKLESTISDCTINQ
jgi:hypothetical protein